MFKILWLFIGLSRQEAQKAKLVPDDDQTDYECLADVKCIYEYIQVTNYRIIIYSHQ